jgi:hypothetical protein
MDLLPYELGAISTGSPSGKNTALWAEMPHAKRHVIAAVHKRLLFEFILNTAFK